MYAVTLQIRTSCLWLNAPTPPTAEAFSFGLLLPPIGGNDIKTRGEKSSSAGAEFRSTAALLHQADEQIDLRLSYVCMYACVCVCKPVRGDFTINIYVWQTDQWLLKRSRGDDDGYWLCVLIKSGHADKLQIHICAYIQYVCTCARTHTGQMIGINSSIMLNLS